MILKTGEKTIEINQDGVLVDGQQVARGEFSYFFTDQPADSTFHLEPKSQEPVVGMKLVVFQKGEEHPVYQSFPITEIQ
jgi:hypothetical protein